MASPVAFRRHDQKQHRYWLLPLCLAAVALFCLAVGANGLWQHARGQWRPYRAPAGVLIVILAMVQLAIVRHIWLRREGKVRSRLFGQPLFWRWLLVGLVVCYVIGLALGPNPYVRYFFRASLTFWYTVSLLPLVVQPATLARWASLGQVPVFRRLGQAVFVASLCFVSIEATLRLADLAIDEQLPLDYTAQRLKLAPGSQYHGRLVNQQGYWDDEFNTAPRPGCFRIAALGDGITLSGTMETNCLDQLEHQLPGIEVYHFGIPLAGPREYAAQLAREVAWYHPDLVLIFVSIGDDITQPDSTPGYFDWRTLRVWQLGARSLLAPTATGPLANPSDQGPRDYEAYLRQSAQGLAVCRTPINDWMQQRWQLTTSYLDKVVQQCRRREIAVGLVLVPGEFQVSRTLLKTLCRRMGYTQSQIDLELPQRTLTGFALSRQLPVLDLLPYFRASGTSPYRLHTDDWNECGHDITAEVIGGWLQRRYGAMIAANEQASASAGP